LQQATRYTLFLFLIGCLAVTSCSVGKNLKDDSYIYTNTNLNFIDQEEAKSINNFKRLINSIPENGTETGIGNIYIGLHNLYDETGESGFKHWVKYKLGREPILYEESMLEKTSSRLSYYLNGKGFFGHSVTCDAAIEDKLASVDCEIQLGQRYTIDSLAFPIDSTYVTLKLDEELQRAILKEGNFYDRDRLDYERVRLASLAGEMGFADFGSDNIHYYVDTSQMNNTVDIYLKVISPTDSTTHTRYILDTIKVFPNYTIDNPSRKDLLKVEVDDGLFVYESNHYLDHELLDRLILQKPNEYFNRTYEKRSVNRMLDLGLFRFINVNNIPNPQLGEGHFNQEIYLTPELIQSISGEVELNNRSGNYLGTGASINYLHRNIFKQGAQLKGTIGGQLETQFGDGVSLINSSDLTGGIEIIFPKVITPFVTIKEGRTYVPRTVLETNYTYQRRSGYYTLRSLNGRFGYKWREKPTVYHELYPLALNQVSVFNKSAQFQEVLINDPRLQSSFQNILIGGIQYLLTYNDQSGTRDNQYSQFKMETELSGNMFSLLSTTGQNGIREIASLPYAQFFKMTMDYRRYVKLSNSRIAARVILGAGITYGNSKELPYIKQYLIGGSNSLRAFRLRGLGPGLFFVEPSSLGSFESQFVDQTGDIKLEMNLEHRFPIFSYLKGATFLDAGNIWLISNDQRPEGNFHFDDFYKQIALGTGFGFRLDFEFFVIRLDLAFQLRGPTVSNEFQWKIKDVDIFSSEWRSKNLIYNLGIGYPF